MTMNLPFQADAIKPVVRSQDVVKMAVEQADDVLTGMSGAVRTAALSGRLVA